MFLCRTYHPHIRFICENEDKINGLVNFEKLQMMGEILRSIKTMQSFPYTDLRESAFLTDFLSKSPVFNDEQLQQLSDSLSSRKKTIGFDFYQVKINHS